MHYTKEFDVHNFPFWSGARDRVSGLDYDKLEELGQLIEDVFCDSTPTETQINDFVWFDCDDFFGDVEEDD